MNPKGRPMQRDIMICIIKLDAAGLYLNCFEGTLFSISFLRAFSVSFSIKIL